MVVWRDRLMVINHCNQKTNHYYRYRYRIAKTAYYFAPHVLVCVLAPDHFWRWSVCFKSCGVVVWCGASMHGQNKKIRPGSLYFPSLYWLWCKTGSGTDSIFITCSKSLKSVAVIDRFRSASALRPRAILSLHTASTNLNSTCTAPSRCVT